jgi:hypothetical protein
MEPVTLIAVIVGAAVLLGLGWVLLKFFFRVAKHIIIAVVLGVAVMLCWYQPWNLNRAAQNPNIGKAAYAATTGNYLGKIVGADDREGEWIVERPGGYHTKYPKSKVNVKDK